MSTKSIILNTKSIVLNTKSISFNTKFIAFNANRYLEEPAIASSSVKLAFGRPSTQAVLDDAH